MQLSALQFKGTLDSVHAAKSPQLMRGPLDRPTTSMPVHPTRPRTAHLTLLVLAVTGCNAGASHTSADRPPLGIMWRTVPTDSGVVHIAVARPSGEGPFPAVLILHGTHGFAKEYVELARDLADEGFISVAACWFRGGAGAGQRFIRPIPCEGGPNFVDAPGSDRFRLSRITIEALVKALRANREVGSLAAFGHSRGGGAVLDYALSNPHAFSALILNSAGYPDEIITRAGTVRVPVLVLHGERDDPSDGGSAMTGVSRARSFEEALKRAGIAVESNYYVGGHNALFADTVRYNDAVRRIAAFVRRNVTR